MEPYFRVNFLHAKDFFLFEDLVPPLLSDNGERNGGFGLSIADYIR
jgi:hypothetical protein